MTKATRDTTARVLTTILGIILLAFCTYWSQGYLPWEYQAVRAPFLFAALIFLGMIQDNYAWANRFFMGIHYVIVFGTAFYVGSVTIPYPTETGYIIVAGDLVIIFFLLAGGWLFGVLTSFPLKLIQSFYCDTELYESSDTPVSQPQTQGSTTKKRSDPRAYEMRLSVMTETELQLELKAAINCEEYQLAQKIQKALERFR